MPSCVSLATNRQSKGEKRRLGTAVIMGRFGGKYALVLSIGAYLEVDLEDMRSANRFLEVLGCDGKLRLHLPTTNSPIRYSVGSRTLIPLSEMRNGISNSNQTTTWGNTDARTSPDAFYEPNRKRPIAIHEMGGVGALNDFTEHLGSAGELKRGEGTKDAITELKSLIIGHRIGSNSADNAEIPGALSDRTAEALSYGKAKKSGADLKIGKIKKAIIDFANQAKMWRIGMKTI